MDEGDATEILRLALLPMARARGWEISHVSVSKDRSESTPGGHLLSAKIEVKFSLSSFVAGDYGEPHDELESRIRLSAAAIAGQLPHMKNPSEFAFCYGWLPLVRENMALKQYVPTGIQLDILRNK